MNEIMTKVFVEQPWFRPGLLNIISTTEIFFYYSFNIISGFVEFHNRSSVFASVTLYLSVVH